MANETPPPGSGDSGEGKTPEFEAISISDEMRRSYLDYAMSVIVSRALPDVRDGLKPVHRRILYSMHENGRDWNKPYRKCALIVGDVMGKYHPHGDQSIYDALVRMAQEFSMRVPLIDGQGNFGSVDGDPPAAMRYTEARRAKVAHSMTEDIDKDTVDFRDNYDGSEREPVVLPARFPNLLVNGGGGIAVGMATNIPPHNLGEVIDATMALIDDPTLTIPQLMEFIPGPDFPTGGIILGRGGIRSAYETGRGSIVMRGKVTVETVRREREALVVHEIPFQVNKATMIEKIAEMVHDKRIEGIADIRDESDRDGMRVVIELKRDAMADVVLNQLWRFSALQTSFGANFVALNGGRPETMNLRDMLVAFVAFREEVVTRRTKFLLTKARDRAHVLVGLAIAVAHIDEVIKVIRHAKDPNSAREELMSRRWPAKDVASLIALIDDPRHRLEKDGTYILSDAQARAILELRLARLTALGREEIADELNKIAAEITDFLAILRSRARVRGIIKDELTAIRAEFATPRKTVIEDGGADLEDEDLIQREDMVVTVTHAGWIKRVPLDSYRAQRRGGKGRSGMATKEEDFVTRLFVANTHTPILFFSSRGIVYKDEGLAAAAGRPAGARQGAGQPAAAQPERAHHLHPAAARERGGVGRARRGLRHQGRHHPPQQALRLRPGEPQRQDRHEVRQRGGGDRRRAAVHRGRRRPAHHRCRPVHPLPGKRRARLQGARFDRRARHRSRQGRQRHLHGDPAPFRCHRRRAQRLPQDEPGGARRGRGGGGRSRRRGGCGQ